MFSNGSTNTLTNGVKEEMTPILLKKKSHSAPESDSSSSIYDATPVPKKKLSLDGALLTQKSSATTDNEFVKENRQKMLEKDLDETSDCLSVGRVTTISPVANLTSVNDKCNFIFC